MCLKFERQRVFIFIFQICVRLNLKNEGIIFLQLTYICRNRIFQNCDLKILYDLTEDG